MDHQLHPKPQCRCQGESPENNDQETAGVGHRPDPNPNLHRERLCAVVLITRQGKRGKTYAVRWIDQSTDKMRCDGGGRDKVLARRLVEKKRADLRAGRLSDVQHAGFDEFITMVLARMKQKGRAAATVVETKRALGLLEMVCDPRDVAAITVNMLDRFDAARAAAVRRCKHQRCRWPNMTDAGCSLDAELRQPTMAADSR